MHRILKSLMPLMVVLALGALWGMLRFPANAAGPNPAPQALPGITKIYHAHLDHSGKPNLRQLFGTYPGAGGFPPFTCLPNLSESTWCVKPFPMPEGMPLCDLNHSWEAGHASYDNGRMDGFAWAEGSAYTMGYLDGGDIPNYWNYARHCTLYDRFFSSLTGPSLPNHLAELHLACPPRPKLDA
jgi:hypothetical protein